MRHPQRLVVLGGVPMAAFHWPKRTALKDRCQSKQSMRPDVTKIAANHWFAVTAWKANGDGAQRDPI